MTLDIEIYDEYGPGFWAQERYLVHLHDDVLWTSDIDQAVSALREDLIELDKP